MVQAIQPHTHDQSIGFYSERITGNYRFFALILQDFANTILQIKKDSGLPILNLIKAIIEGNIIL